MSAALPDRELVELVITRRRCSQRALAAILGVTESATSRWRRDLQRISPSHRASLLYLLAAEGEAPR